MRDGDEVGFALVVLVAFVVVEEEEEEAVGWMDDDGRKEMERVPENRMTDTARATGRTAVKGLG